MASRVREAFRDAVAAGVPEEMHHLLDPAIGSGPETREFARAYKLSERAMGWTGDALGIRAPTAANPLESPPRIDRPEFGPAITQVAALQRKQHRDDPDLFDLCRKLELIGEQLLACDSEATAAKNMTELTAIATMAGEVLVGLGNVRGDAWEWVCEQANEAV